MNRRFALITLSALILGACATGGASFRSKTVRPAKNPIQSLLVIFDAKHRYFDGTRYDGFVQGTQRYLESCGLKVSTTEIQANSDDKKSQFKKIIEQNSQDAALFFFANGYSVNFTPAVLSGNLGFGASTHENKEEKPFWVALIDYNIHKDVQFPNESAEGDQLAAQLVSKLAADRVITGCPEINKSPK